MPQKDINLETDSLLSQIMKHSFAPMSDFLANCMSENLEVKGQGFLLTKESYIAQKKQKITKSAEFEFLKRQKRLQKAGEILKKALPLLPTLEKERIEKEISHLLEEVISFLTPSKSKSTENYDTTFGLSKKTFQWMYFIGHRLSTEHNHEDALCIFFLLTLLNPLVADYFVAQGLTERFLQCNADALYSFAMASFLNPNHLASRYNSAEIYLELGQVDDAKEELSALEKIVKKENFTNLNSEIETLHKKIRFSKT